MPEKVFSDVSLGTVLCCFGTDVTWRRGYKLHELKRRNMNIETFPNVFSLFDDPVHSARNIHILPSLALFLPL
jgi:hypothetical protein